MITLSKLAKLAHVSVSTASKAFSMSSEVSNETRQHIFDVAKQYGCFKKFFNAKYPKYVIAVICSEIDSASFARHISYIQKRLNEKNCEICIAIDNFSDETENELIDYYYKYSNVDGIIVLGSRSPESNASEVPVVYASPLYPKKDCVSVSINIENAFRESMDYLFGKGVDSVGFIGEKLTWRKFERYKQVLAENNIAYNENIACITEERFENGGYSAMQSILDTKQLPRAVICAYDYMAIGAIKCIHDNGLRVPEDIAVLGMDDISSAKFLNPPLASICSNYEKADDIVVDAILKQINGEEVESVYCVEGEFILRRSFEID